MREPCSLLVALLLLLLLVIVIAADIGSATISDAPDLVPYLDGIGNLDHRVYSGYVNVDAKHGAHLYYLFFESLNSPSTDPLVIWLNGGPGCSSLFGAFIENGPFSIDANATTTGLHRNPFSWTAKANVLYIDQPVGTGFSYVVNPTGYVTSEKKMATELYVLLHTFLFKLHPEFSHHDLYIFGESYAGKYIPSISDYILQQNANTSETINLRGIGIGDGWVSPYWQTGSYASFLWSNRLITEKQLHEADLVNTEYQKLIDKKMYIAAAELGNLLLEGLVLAAGGVDVYDVRTKKDPTDPLSSALTSYLNRHTVQDQLHVGSHHWKSCGAILLTDEARSVETLLPRLLANMTVLLYNGNQDLICNYLGTAVWSSKIQWPHQKEYNEAEYKPWFVDSTFRGIIRQAATLSFLILNDAGHFVPYNLPQISQEMLYRFIDGKL